MEQVTIQSTNYNQTWYAGTSKSPSSVVVPAVLGAKWTTQQDKRLVLVNWSNQSETVSNLPFGGSVSNLQLCRPVVGCSAANQDDPVSVSAKDVAWLVYN